MGGLLSAFIAAQQDTSSIKFTGMCVAAPYFDLYDKEMLNKLKPIISLIN
jgi:hypothetical protein